MANLAKIFEDAGGYKLTLAQAKRLHKAKEIAAPTLVALKNYFLNKVIAPKLKKAGENLSRNPSSRDISNLRKVIPELLKINVDGNEHNLISLNKLWTAIQTSEKSGEPLANASSFLRDDYRTRAGFGLDENSRNLADFYDDIDNLRAIRDRDLANASGPDEPRAIKQQFDRGMQELWRVKRYRKILPTKNNRKIEYSPLDEEAGHYGWRAGKSRGGFLQQQSAVYEGSNAQARYINKMTGKKLDSGHSVPLGGIIISDADRQKYFISKSELEENPDGEGWILRGTNSLTNLAIEAATGNRSKRNVTGRDLEEILRMQTAFTKSRSIAEYNLTDDKTFRKNTDYSAALRSLLHHSDINIDELEAIGENQILQTGIEEPGTLTKSQHPKQIDSIALKQSTQTQGPLVEYTQRGNQVFNPRVDGEPLGPGGGGLIQHLLSIQNGGGLPNLLSVGPNTPQHMKGIAKFVSGLIPHGDKVIAADEVLTETFSSNPNTSRGYAKLAEQPLNVIGATTLNKPDLGTQVKNVTGVVQGIKDKNVAEVISSGAGLFSQQSIEKINDEDKDLLLTGS